MAVGLPAQLPELLPIKGIRLATVEAGIRKDNKPDLVVFEVCENSQCAAVFTRNAFCAAPVFIAKKHLSIKMPRYLMINSGNANAGTGDKGIQDAKTCCQELAKLTACAPNEVLPFSTGVIGEPLPMFQMSTGLAKMAKAYASDGWNRAAHGIMTTDTVPKGVSRQVTIHDEKITITGIAKGSGMICPDMATMLAFIATDAKIKQPVLQKCLGNAVAQSFNCITVDGDTSTNDACVLLATGQTIVPYINEQSDGYDLFVNAVTEVCLELAQAIVRDGEGATKFITVEVLEGKSDAECKQIAYTIAHSPLIKTAFFASDPNWGRILAAVGKAGSDFLDVDKVSIYLNEACVVWEGERSKGYMEHQGITAMEGEEITIRVILGRGSCRARIWTCDLSYDYVRINAEYRS